MVLCVHVSLPLPQQEGDPAQDLDTVLSRFDLTGNQNIGKMRSEL